MNSWAKHTQIQEALAPLGIYLKSSTTRYEGNCLSLELSCIQIQAPLEELLGTPTAVDFQKISGDLTPKPYRDLEQIKQRVDEFVLT